MAQSVCSTNKTPWCLAVKVAIKKADNSLHFLLCLHKSVGTKIDKAKSIKCTRNLLLLLNNNHGNEEIRTLLLHYNHSSAA